jgi:hypothetical protein
LNGASQGGLRTLHTLQDEAFYTLPLPATTRVISVGDKLELQVKSSNGNDLLVKSARIRWFKVD